MCAMETARGITILLPYSFDVDLGRIDHPEVEKKLWRLIFSLPTIPIFQTAQKKTTSEQSLPVQKFNTDFISLLLLTCKLILPFNDFSHMGAHRQT